MISTDRTITHHLDALRPYLCKNRLHRNILDCSFDKHHLSIQQRFQSCIVSNRRIYLAIRSKGQTISCTMKKPIPFVAMKISCIDQLALLRTPRNRYALVAKMTHQTIRGFITHKNLLPFSISLLYQIYVLITILIETTFSPISCALRACFLERSAAVNACQSRCAFGLRSRGVFTYDLFANQLRSSSLLLGKVSSLSR